MAGWYEKRVCGYYFQKTVVSSALFRLFYAMEVKAKVTHEIHIRNTVRLHNVIIIFQKKNR